MEKQEMQTKKNKNTPRKIKKEIAQYLIPMNIVYDTVIAGLFIIISGQIINLILNHLHSPGDSCIKENIFKRASIAIVIFYTTVIIYRAFKKDQVKKILISVILYSLIIGFISWIFFVGVIITDNGILIRLSEPEFYYRLAIFSIQRVVPYAVIWLLLILILAVLCKFLKKYQRAFPIRL
jgi:hypothetical protein